MEENLHFLGFLLFENRLKSESSGVILRLQEALIRTIMVTGLFPTFNISYLNL